MGRAHARVRVQQNAVNPTEDRGVGGDAHRHGQDRDRGESRVLSQGSLPVSKVFP